MTKSGMGSFPLTTAQRGIWTTQKITPRANLNIAEAVEIRGPVNHGIFRQALRQLVTEAEELRVGIVEEDGKPRQFPRLTYPGDFPFLDMSNQAHPERAIHAWMMDELSQPIDLARDPLWVSALLKAGDNQYFWYQRAHHIVYDGYGGGLAARRLADIYSAYAQGREPEPNCFCAVEAMVAAEATYRNSDRFERDREYWHRQLANLPETATLSRSRRRHQLSSNLRRSVGSFSAETVRQLKELGATASASLPQVLIGLIIAYYHRATGVSDLVVGMPVSGRISSVLRKSLAVSANVVPIRISFTPEMTAAGLFGEVSRVVRQALRHQQYRFENLRRDLGLVGSDQNLAWLGVNIEPFDYRLNFDGATATSHNLSNSSAEDLMTFVYDRGTDTDLRFDLDANPSLYGEEELNEHRRRLTYLADQILANPGTPLRRLDILGAEERRRLLLDWNDTAGLIPETTLPAIVARWAARTPAAPAVVFEDTTLSYWQLHQRSVELARQLIEQGVKPGDIVAVALSRTEQLPVVLLAIMRTGAAYLPLDTESPADRIRMVIEDASPAVLIADDPNQALFSQYGVRLLNPESLNACNEADSEPEPDLSKPDGVVYVLYTSGSTGRPKGVQVTHRNLANFLRAMEVQLMPVPSDRYLAVTTLIFDIAGLELFLPLTSGARVIMAGNEALHSPPILARLIQHSGATHVQATPSLWRILLSCPETNLDGVHALVGGEALSADLASRLRTMADGVTQFYGPTETTIWSTAFEIEEVGTEAPPIGRPILNTQVYVLDEDRQPVMTGAAGELYIGGEGVALGYLNRPQLTEERFMADPFSGDGSRMYRTGDLVRWNDDGELEFIGRVDAQIKINGHRVELGDIESHLLQHATVAQAAAAVHRSSDGTVSLAGYVVATDGVRVDPDTLRKFISASLPSYMVPRTIMVLDALPLTPNGKLDRRSLPVPERATRELYAEPVTQTEKKLATLWRKVLKVEWVGLHDNFFDLGGDSLSAAELAAVFPSEFEMELPLGSIFEAPTIAELASMIERLSCEHSNPLGIVLPLRKVVAQAHRPLFCIHPIAGISLAFIGLLRHLDPRVPVYGLQSRGLCDGTGLPGSIEEMAADYLDQILRIQPEGPYRLIGRSLGGLIGHSIAVQMQARGLQVELLAMIDSYLFTGGERARPVREADEVRAVMKFLDMKADAGETPATMDELAKVLVRDYSGRSIPVAQEIMKKNPQFIHHVFAVMLNNMKLARQFVPGRLDLDLVYFEATEGDLQELLGHSPSAWQQFVGGRIEVHELACDHEAVLDPIPAARIGSVLQTLLSAADAQREPEWSAA